ncbi:hypothetical protein, partial [Salmonella sp. SAL04269]|uniref:hypothetical protein n=1 Tax=Salmonella sp. SAL04269 TaxID=3159847 RepID=UPI00397BDBC7
MAMRRMGDSSRPVPPAAIAGLYRENASAAGAIAVAPQQADGRRGARLAHNRRPPFRAEPMPRPGLPSRATAPTSPQDERALLV